MCPALKKFGGSGRPDQLTLIALGARVIVALGDLRVVLGWHIRGLSLADG